MQADEEADDSDVPPVHQPTAEPRVASFKWATKLGVPSPSYAAETSGAPSPQGPGMLGALGELSAAYLGAAKQHMGDLLGMSDAPQQQSAVEHAPCEQAAAPRLPAALKVGDSAAQEAGLTDKRSNGLLSGSSWGPFSEPPNKAVPAPEQLPKHRLGSSSSNVSPAVPASPPTSPFERAAEKSRAGPADAAASCKQPGGVEHTPPRRDSSAHGRVGSGLGETESTTSWGSFRESEHSPAPFQGIPEVPEEAASHSSDAGLPANGHLLDAAGSDVACTDAACFLPAGSALSAPALLRLYAGASRSSSPAAVSPAQSWQAGDEGGLGAAVLQDPFAVQQPAQLAMHRDNSSLPPTKGGAKPSLSQWEQEQIAKFAALRPRAADFAGDI